jgi:hypothetical protein
MTWNRSLAGTFATLVMASYTTSLTARTTCGEAELAMSIRTSGMARR